MAAWKPQPPAFLHTYGTLQRTQHLKIDSIYIHPAPHLGRGGWNIKCLPNNQLTRRHACIIEGSDEVMGEGVVKAGRTWNIHDIFSHKQVK